MNLIQAHLKIDAEMKNCEKTVVGEVTTESDNVTEAEESYYHSFSACRS